MRRKRLMSFKGFMILNALILLFAVNASSAFADFYVIPGGKKVGTEITSLPYTISSPGFYYITKKLTCGAGSHGITINADDVILDLMGFSLNGPGGALAHDGIYLHYMYNVEIRNGIISNFPRHGIYEDSSSGLGHRILSITAKNNAQGGIRLLSLSNTIERCTVMNNSSGVGIYAGTGSIVKGNTCYENGQDGIYAASNCVVSGNNCYSNHADGIYAVTGSTIIGNSCVSNTSYGINVSSYCLISQNTSISNSSGNILSGSGCLLVDNVAP